MPISISIVEDDRGTRDSLVALMNDEDKLRCLGAYANGEDAVRGICAGPPDVALVDIKLPGMSGIDCVAKLKVRIPKLQVLMLTTFEESDLIFNSLRAGASGYLLKKFLMTELIPAVELIHSGGAPMSTEIARKVVDHFHQIRKPMSEIEKLTSREQEVLELLTKGYMYKEIGDMLGIGLTTVRTHLHRLYSKLHVQSRTEATLKYLGRD